MHLPQPHRSSASGSTLGEGPGAPLRPGAARRSSGLGGSKAGLSTPYFFMPQPGVCRRRPRCTCRTCRGERAEAESRFGPEWPVERERAKSTCCWAREILIWPSGRVEAGCGAKTKTKRWGPAGGCAAWPLMKVPTGITGWLAWRRPSSLALLLTHASATDLRKRGEAAPAQERDRFLS